MMGERDINSVKQGRNILLVVRWMIQGLLADVRSAAQDDNDLCCAELLSVAVEAMDTAVAAMNEVIP